MRKSILAGGFWCSVIVSTLLCGVNSVVYAAGVKSSPSPVVQDHNGFYVGITGGVSAGKLDHDQTISQLDSRDNLWTYDYLTNGSYHWEPVGGINGGYEFDLKNNLLLDLGLGLYTTGNFSSSGDVLITSGSIQDKFYTVDYDVRSTYLLGEAKLRWQATQSLLPFVSAGLGAAWNDAKNFTFTSTGLGFATNPFPSRTTTNIAYQLGIGVDYQFMLNNSIGVSYRFSHLGESSFGIKDPNWFPFDFHAGNLNTHSILIDIAHYFY